MESTKPSVYTTGNSAGIDRVRKEEGLYAFFMEAAAIEYHVERKCDLKQLGGLLDSKGYGIALPKGEDFTENLLTDWEHFRLSLHGGHLPGRDPADREGRRDEAQEEVVGGGARWRLMQGRRGGQQRPDGRGGSRRSLHDAHCWHRLCRDHRRLRVHMEEAEACR